MNKNIVNKISLLGIVGVIFYILHDFVGAMFYPGYNWLSQAVSDLTAANAQSFFVASSLSDIYGLCACLCCISVCILVKNKNTIFKTGIYLFTLMNLISAIGYFLFPLGNPESF